MRKIEITIPKGVEYIGQWDDYNIPRGEHCIVDKGVTGCGYTEFALTNKDPIVLCSPRKLLLENKSEKHFKDKHFNILYLDGLVLDKMYEIVEDHLSYCKTLGLPPKFLITYDSTRKIVSCLTRYEVLNDFIFVVDEFQSIFLDSYFKVGVEFDFVDNLQKCLNVVYLSATPMLDKYLDKLDVFKDLPFYKLNWNESGFTETIKIERKRTNSLTIECSKIVNSFLEGKFPMLMNSDNKVVESREAVFYFNSVSEILRVIRRCGLTKENTLIVCSKSENNEKRLKRAKFNFGKIPLKEEPNPMFTFCTSAVYMGVDFFSDCASSYVFADPNVECLALDISLDLPQIIGRQRNKKNPFKNNIVLFYKTKREGDLELTEENFMKYQETKKRKTQNLLDLYNTASEEQRSAYVEKLEDSILVSNYSRDFVSISSSTGAPVYNTLIEIADQRAWDVTQKDYQDTLTVTKAITSLENLDTVVSEYRDENELILKNFLDNQFYATYNFSLKLKFYCEFRDKYKDNPVIMEGLLHRVTNPKIHQFYNYFGTSGCRARHYRENELDKIWRDSTRSDKLAFEIYSTFKEGDRYSKADIKEILRGIYQKLSLSRSPKASDLKDYFELSKTNITTPEGVKSGFKLKKRLL